MARIDVLFRVEIPLADVQTGIAEILGVSPDEVPVIEDIDDYPSAGSCYAVCQAYRLPDGFKQMLTINWPTGSLRERIGEFMARRFRVDCLLPSDSSDPYEMELVHPDGTRKLVSIDAHAVDERGVYLIEG